MHQFDDNVALLQLGANPACQLGLLCATGFSWDQCPGTRSSEEPAGFGGARRTHMLQQLWSHHAVPELPSLSVHSHTI